MEDLITIIGGVTFTWVIISYLRIILDFFEYNKLDRFLCLKCLTFWLLLIYTFNPFIAAIGSFVGYLVDKYILGDNQKINIR